MSTFKISGVVTYVSPIEKFGAGKESKRLIVETQDKYPNFFPVSFYGDKINSIESVKVGDLVKVDTFPGGRCKKGDDTVAFVYLNGWTCTVIPTGSSASSEAPQAKPANAPRQTTFDVDDIPF